MQVVKPSVDLVAITPDIENVIVQAGRICYRSEAPSTKNADFIKRIVASGHESVLEHGSMTFKILTDRGITHEIVRHRIASYSQESTRYCNYSSGRFGREIRVIEPIDIGECRDAWLKACENAEKSYFELIDSGIKPQTARSVLPTCLATEIVMTANVREWRHFLKLRLAPAAHPDIIRVVREILAVCKEQAPSLFADIGQVYEK